MGRWALASARGRLKETGLAQGQFRELVGKGKSLIWSNEPVYGEPDEITLSKTAETLGVAPQSLKGLELDSARMASVSKKQRKI